jgi:formate/nitrite transporter FocA (FNT family)
MASGAADSDAHGIEPDVAPRDEEDTFDRLVDEGEQRLGRSWVQLIATGLLGGLDVGIGVLAYLLVKQQTQDEALAAVAFTSGFIVLSLAGSELFTENFLVPVAAVVAKHGTPVALVRLWATTLLTNLVAGWFVAALVLIAFRRLDGAAVDSARTYIDLGINGHAFAMAVVGGMLITLMTHLQHATESDGVQLVPAVVVGFLLSVGHINHAIVGSIFCFVALFGGAPFGYADWAGTALLAIAGNAVGGIGLVTFLRLAQVSHGPS